LRARILVFPRPEILDPQGKAIHGALGRLDFDEVTSVRAGKSFDVELEADEPVQAEERLREMCEKLLANPVVESYEIQLLDAAAPAVTADEAGQ
jgi:phosphoribosylformylglycinamidine synthase subunit PurS